MRSISYRTVSLVISVAALVAVPRAARADEPSSPPRKSMLVATAASASTIGVLLGAARLTNLHPAGAKLYNGVMLLSLVAAPSLGQHYAHSQTHALVMTTIRGAAVVMMLEGYRHDVESVQVLGAGVLAYGAIYSIIDAPFAARRFNRRHRATAPARIVPTVVPSVGGVAAGLSLSGEF